jgi:hypothetical protein
MILVFVSCLLLSPADCSKQNISMDDAARLPVGCAIGAQQLMADYVRKNPFRFISPDHRFKCVDMEHAGRDI